MAYELERLTGFIEDIRGGDGGPGLATLMWCPTCAGPIRCVIDALASTLTCVCPADPTHYRWYGVYMRLPRWLVHVFPPLRHSESKNPAP
jgi:hypothetical protein